MHLKVTQSTGVSIIHLEGDFLLEPEQKELRDKVHELLKKGTRKLVVDLAGVKHINSCGLGSLVCAFTSARKIGGDLRISGPGTSVQELFNITQLTKIFDIFPTLDAALGEF